MASATEVKANPVLRARNAAVTALIERFPEEFNEEMGKAAAEFGITWQPVLSAEDKAAAEIEALLVKHPSLRVKFSASGEIPGQTAIG